MCVSNVPKLEWINISTNLTHFDKRSEDYDLNLQVTRLSILPCLGTLLPYLPLVSLRWMVFELILSTRSWAWVFLRPWASREQSELPHSQDVFLPWKAAPRFVWGLGRQSLRVLRRSPSPSSPSGSSTGCGSSPRCLFVHAHARHFRGRD